MTDIHDITPPVIGSLLFGSEARGDYDEYSDRDICAFFREITMAERPKVRECLATIYCTKAPSVCMYSKSTAQGMAQKGSLFLWHLKLESRVLYDPEGFVAQLFATIAPYSGYQTDMSRYEEIALGVSRTLDERGSLNNADLHALFVAWRNTCLLLTMSQGAPVFARKTALSAAQKMFPNLPEMSKEYEILSNYHLFYSRNVNLLMPDIRQTDQKLLVRDVLAFIRQARTLLKI